MTWTWQRSDWPEFTWQPSRVARAEEQFLIGGGVFLGTVSHLGDSDREQVTAEVLSVEAVSTSAIEGEILNRASVQSSIRRQLGLATDFRRIKPAEQGIAEVMVDLHRSFAEPLSDEMLFGWHRMLMSGRRDLQDMGGYRRHSETMQIVSGALHAPQVHYEAPPSIDMPREMAHLVDWFNRTAPNGSNPLPALTRAGIAHFYFVCVHPFEDGNGRIGRAISEKVLALGLGRPTLTALAATILGRRKGYYEALERSNTGTDLTEWLDWFAAVVIAAQQRSIALVEFLIGKTRLLDSVTGRLNERQHKVLLRVLRDGPDGFEGGLSAGNYASITGAAAATVTRDLADLVAKGVLLRAGERRYARYQVNIPVSQGSLFGR